MAVFIKRLRWPLLSLVCVLLEVYKMVHGEIALATSFVCDLKGLCSSLEMAPAPLSAIRNALSAGPAVASWDLVFSYISTGEMWKAPTAWSQLFLL